MAGRQHPCSCCGKQLESDNCCDVVHTIREPREDRRSSRSTASKYLPPNRVVIDHLYLCHDCSIKMSKFFDAVKEGGMV